MNSRVVARIAGVLLLSFAAPNLACAIDVFIDYRYDTSDFFNPGTANGAAAQSTVNAAATFFSSIITDTLTAIPYVDPNTPGDDNTPVWRQIITHPGSGLNYSISSAANLSQDGLGSASEYRDIQIPSNRFLIYVGARNLNTVGEGGPGGFHSFGSPTFNSNISRRGKPANEFSSWGGYVAFDNVGTSWHYNHSQAVPSGKTDLFSVALHEIGHVLGLNPDLSQGMAAQWDAFQVGAEFQGPQALAAWKADDPSAPAGATGIPTVSATNTHWKDNLQTAPQTPSVRSYVLGALQLQEAAMDPTIFAGSRKRFTNVDTKALRDIGWTIPSSVFNVTAPTPGDFNADGYVNGADIAVWKTAFGANNSANADGDSDSDGNDFLIWQRRLGTTPALAALTSESAAVPEPGAVLLAAGGGLSLLILARARRA